MYFGAAANSSTTTVIQTENGGKDVMYGYGCSATFLNGLTKEEPYIWSSIPQLTWNPFGPFSDCYGSHYDRRLCIYGGYASGEKIKMFGEVHSATNATNVTNATNIMVNTLGCPLSNVQCWTIALTTGPSHCTHWSVDKSRKPAYHLPALITIQHCYKYDVYCYTDILFIIDNSDESNTCSFLVDKLSKHVKCVIIDDTIFIVNGNKMAKIEYVYLQFQLSTTTFTSTSTKPINSVDFTINVPRVNSTPFVIKETLFIVGGCDEDSEPFSEIYQFVPERQEWKVVGHSTVSRYGASAVVVTDKNNQQAVFIAGGFKGEGMPCNVIEQIPIFSQEKKTTLKKRSATEAAL